MDTVDLVKQEQSLVQINLEDMLISLGVQNLKTGRKILEWMFLHPAKQFSRQVLDYDRGVAEYGLAEGARRLLQSYVRGLEVSGTENLPTTGPLLILANHPGMTDTVALFASLGRNDLRILAAERPFLKALPATSRYLYFIPEEGEGRIEAVRQSARHLRSGGAVLTFPAGKIEPDPCVRPGAAASLSNWATSIGAFVRMVPGLWISPVIVSGVIAPQAYQHPITRLRRSEKDRERLGATLQILMKTLAPNAWPLTVNVDIFPPISGEELKPLHDPEKITAEIIRRIRPYYLKMEERFGINRMI